MHKLFLTAALPPAMREKCYTNCVLDSFDLPRPMTAEELKQSLSQGKYDALICTYKDHITPELLAAAGPQLKVVGTMSAGMNHIDRAVCADADITVQNVPGATSQAVADYALALALIGIRRLDRHLHSSNSMPDQAPWHFLGNLHGKTLSDCKIGILGMGRIGKEVAQRLTGFGADISYFSRNTKPKEEHDYHVTKCTLLELFAESDAVIVTCALTEETHHLIDTRLLMHANPGLVLVNVARGEICENSALVNALNDKKLGAYLTDATAPEPLPQGHPLWQHPNCFIFPHMATNTWDSREKIAHTAIKRALEALNRAAPAQASSHG